MIRRRLLLSLGALTLAGCSPLPADTSRVRAGRFSLRAVKGDKTDSLSGRWRLLETADTLELTLMTPLYGILARIRVTPAGAELERPNKTGENARDTAESAEALMQRHLGFALPTRMLSSWLSGRPWEGLSSARTAEGFVQSGWSVTVRRTNENGEPALVALSQPENALQAGLSLTLTIE